MKKQRKIVFWAASLLLTGALAAGGTLAYLTDKDSVTNQFVVGKVDIDTFEGRVTTVVCVQVASLAPRRSRFCSGVLHFPERPLRSLRFLISGEGRQLGGSCK